MLSFKTWILTGLVSLLLAIGLVSEYRVNKAQGVRLDEATLTITTLRTDLNTEKEEREKMVLRLKAIEETNTKFTRDLRHAIAKDPADGAAVTPAAVVSELCKRLRCSP